MVSDTSRVWMYSTLVECALRYVTACSQRHFFVCVVSDTTLSEIDSHLLSVVSGIARVHVHAMFVQCGFTCVACYVRLQQLLNVVLDTSRIELSVLSSMSRVEVDATLVECGFRSSPVVYCDIC